ncbi:hypothetical protein ACFW0H_04845 [Pseudomonas sp. CR3202]|uniref:hypothetical protein n=1 Tax=Pseudomonas sp. CR3202 TaxID=3351532 RepID=UPI003BF2C8CE
MSFLLEHFYQSVNYKNTAQKFLQSNAYGDATAAIHDPTSQANIKGGTIENQQKTYAHQEYIRPVTREEIKQGLSP